MESKVQRGAKYREGEKRVQKRVKVEEEQETKKKNRQSQNMVEKERELSVTQHTLSNEMGEAITYSSVHVIESRSLVRAEVLLSRQGATAASTTRQSAGHDLAGSMIPLG